MPDTFKILIRDGQAQFRDPGTGERVEVPRDQIDQALDRGLDPLSRRAVRKEELGGAAKVGALELLNSITFGGAHAFRRGVLGTPQEDIAFQRAIEPEAAAAGQVGGTLASFLIHGGAIARAGRAAQVAARGVLGAKAVKSAKVAGALGEGLVSGVGQEVAQLAGEDVGAGEIARRVAKSATVNAALTGTLGVVGAGLAGGTRALAERLSGVLGGAQTKLAAAFAGPGATGTVLSNLSRLSPKLGNVLKASGKGGGAGSVIAKSLGDLVAVKMGVGSFKTAAELVAKAGTPLGQTAIRGFTSGVTAVGAGEQRTTAAIEERLRGNLGVSYMASASESLSSGALSPDALPDQIPNLGAFGKVGMTPRNVKDIVTDAKLQDADSHRAAAFEGYTSAGFSPESAQAFADFHARRLEILKSLDVSTPVMAVRARQTVDAVMNPAALNKRLANAEPTPEDIEVTEKLYPEYFAELTEAARLALDSDELDEKLSAKQRFFLQQLDAGRHRRSFDSLVGKIQEAYAQRFALSEGQPPPASASTANLTLPSQATALESAQQGLIG